MRCIFGMKSRSVEDFHVVVVCHETPQARRIRRSVSVEIAATVPRARRCSRSLGSDQVENVMIPHSMGDAVAIREIR